MSSFQPCKWFLSTYFWKGWSFPVFKVRERYRLTAWYQNWDPVFQRGEVNMAVDGSQQNSRDKTMPINYNKIILCNITMILIHLHCFFILTLLIGMYIFIKLTLIGNIWSLASLITQPIEVSPNNWFTLKCSHKQLSHWCFPELQN